MTLELLERCELLASSQGKGKGAVRMEPACWQRRIPDDQAKPDTDTMDPGIWELANRTCSPCSSRGGPEPTACVPTTWNTRNKDQGVILTCGVHPHTSRQFFFKEKTKEAHVGPAAARQQGFADTPKMFCNPRQCKESRDLAPHGVCNCPSKAMEHPRFADDGPAAF